MKSSRHPAVSALLVAAGTSAVTGTPGDVAGGFDPNANAYVSSAALQSDGKILILGGFSAVGGGVAVRLNPIGMVDTGFSPSLGPNSSASNSLVEPDGRILIMGIFMTVGGVPRNGLARLNADGTLDAGFNPPSSGGVLATVVQADGKIVIGGSFTSMGGTARNHLARLNADGTLDTGFDPNANFPVFSATAQADGKILIGGNFTTVGAATRNNIARLDNDPSTQTLSAPTSARVQWLRGGSSSEVDQVSFELSTDGGASWTTLGAGTRLVSPPAGQSSGWELNGLSLPASGQLRACARNYSTAASGIIESVISFVTSPLQLWRFSHFGVYENSGDAADDADPDGDGLENLVEFAFGLDPRKSDAAALPAWELADGEYVLNFTSPAEAAQTTYVAEYSTSLAPGSWTSIANTATAPAHRYRFAAFVSQRLFLRMRVAEP